MEDNLKMSIKTLTSHCEDDLVKTGIYTIVNHQREKIYIGSASYINPKSSLSGFWGRWRGHLWHLRNNKHCNTHLQRAWNKYGSNVFEFKIVEFVSPEFCIEREQFYLDNSDKDSLYNICSQAGNTLGMKHTEEALVKMAEYRAEEFVLYSPEGEKVEGKNLSKFARDSNLDKATLRRVFLGKNFHYKGWTNSLENHTIWAESNRLRGITVSKYGCFTVKYDWTYKTLEEAIIARDRLEQDRGKKFIVTKRDVTKR